MSVYNSKPNITLDMITAKYAYGKREVTITFNPSVPNDVILNLDTYLASVDLMDTLRYSKIEPITQLVTEYMNKNGINEEVVLRCTCGVVTVTLNVDGILMIVTSMGVATIYHHDLGRQDIVDIICSSYRVYLITSDSKMIVYNWGNKEETVYDVSDVVPRSWIMNDEERLMVIGNGGLYYALDKNLCRDFNSKDRVGNSRYVLDYDYVRATIRNEEIIKQCPAFRLVLPDVVDITGFHSVRQIKKLKGASNHS